MFLQVSAASTSNDSFLQSAPFEEMDRVIYKVFTVTSIPGVSLNVEKWPVLCNDAFLKPWTNFS